MPLIFRNSFINFLYFTKKRENFKRLQEKKNVFFKKETERTFPDAGKTVSLPLKKVLETEKFCRI